MRILIAWLVGLRFVRSTPCSSLVKLFVEVVVEAVSVSAEESAGSDVCCSLGDDASGVVCKAVVPLLVEAFGETPEVGDEEAQAVVVVFLSKIHAPAVECVVEVAAAECFCVAYLVLGVSVWANGEGGRVEAFVAHAAWVMTRSGAMSMT